MSKNLRIALSTLLIAPLAMSLFASPSWAASCPDEDGDGYITLSTETAKLILSETFLPDGTYAPEQWQNFFETYKKEVATTPDTGCDNVAFRTGAEPVRCDSPLVSPSSGIYDSAKVSTLAGNKVNPGAYDIPGNGIDENCDGADGTFLPGNAPGVGKDVGGLAQKAINRLGQVVLFVSVMVMIWGGILYATAAGDEQKTAKARKAIIGALIGLIIGLVAPMIVNYVAFTLT